MESTQFTMYADIWSPEKFLSLNAFAGIISFQNQANKTKTKYYDLYRKMPSKSYLCC